ncbi:MAG: ABC transporter permease [Candidatus Rokubacteria bacterium]|nr:ABC transporter permease [Candidatus Rokubacteria bacterium]
MGVGRALRDSAPAAAAIVAFLAVWQLATVVWDIPLWLLPSPKAITLALWEGRVWLLGHLGVTLYETVVGFLLGVVVGIPLAALLVSSDLIWRTLYPILAAVQSIPKTAVAPLLLVWLGAGELPKVIIAFLIAFFPIVVNTATGMTLVEQDLLHLVRSLSGTKMQTFWHIRLPNALPHIFSACKVAVTLAVVGAVIGEFVGADRGLGYIILVASSQLKTDVAFVAILLLAALGMALFWAVSVVERWLLPWCGPQRERIVQA